MSKRLIRSWALSALACWLTLLASADDFNLARFLLPPAESSSEDLLPLDDPNCDFTQSAQARAPAHSGRDSGGNPPSIPLRSAGMNRTSLPASPMPGQLPRLCSHMPLRC